MTLPVRFAVTVPAEKFPDTSRLTMVLAVLLFVAAFAASSAECTFAAVEPPTELTVAATAPEPLAVTSLVNEVMVPPDPVADPIKYQEFDKN